MGGARATIPPLTGLARDFRGMIYKDTAPSGAARKRRQERDICRTTRPEKTISQLRQEPADPDSHRLKNIPLVVFNVEPAQQLDILLSKRAARMMPLLILNIPDHRVHLGARIRKRPKPFLPGESSVDPSLLVDEPRGVGFDIAHQFRKREVGAQAEQQVHMVRHVINRQQLLILSGDNPRDVLL